MDYDFGTVNIFKLRTLEDELRYLVSFDPELSY